MNEIKCNKFYREKMIVEQTNKKKISNFKFHWVTESRKMPSYILSPPDFWKEFDKQADALGTAFKESNEYETLCTFAYQRDNGYRKFVVAHPEMYWWHYEHRSPDKRCSYEVCFPHRTLIIFN